MIVERIERAFSWIRRATDFEPEVGVVLGSGLGPLADDVTPIATFPTADIPGYPPSTVAGHEGRLVFAMIGKRKVVLLKGRIHAYEGYGLDEVTLPIRLMAQLGAKTLVLTNAAGGIAKTLHPGDIMLIEDHLNLQGSSPLRGPNFDYWGPRFPDMSEVYDARYRTLAAATAERLGIPLARGVYASLPGPQYETPAEVRMLRILGADAVGMSTVPEAIVARHMGVRVLGFSVISNLAAGISESPLSHDEVMETGRRVSKTMTDLVRSIIGEMEMGS